MPDNGAVEHAWDGTTLRVWATEPASGITKTIEIEGVEAGTVRVRHRLANGGAAAVEVAPWALTVCAEGGRAVVPQEPFLPHPDVLTPARPLVLWHYTDMSDPRFTWGRRYLQVRQEPGSPTKAKVGLYNHQGWAAYVRGDTALIKRYPTDPDGTYADLGCNTEIFTNESMLELETLGPLVRLEPGAEAVHDEHWSIVRAESATPTTTSTATSCRSSRGSCRSVDRRPASDPGRSPVRRSACRRRVYSSARGDLMTNLFAANRLR